MWRYKPSRIRWMKTPRLFNVWQPSALAYDTSVTFSSAFLELLTEHCSLTRSHDFTLLILLSSNTVPNLQLFFPSAKLIRSRITIVEFSVSRPIVQVFHLLVWTQHYLKLHNCDAFQLKPTSAIPSSNATESNLKLDKVL